MRVNVRGVLRQESGVTRRYVVALEPTPLEARVSMSAIRLTLGLSSVTGEVVLPSPVELVIDATLLGMALARENTAALIAHRVILLVRGTGETVCEPLDPDAKMHEQTFKISSSGVQCLLSKTPVHVDLAGCCDMRLPLYLLPQWRFPARARCSQ